jgi:hypothetical protein
MRLISYNTFCCFKFTILFCIFSVAVFCSTEKIKKSENIRFALINNTLGESPYSGLGPKLKPVIKKINDDNPVFLAHLGSMVCGGTEWYGITKIDMERQYSELYSETSALLPILYTVKGDSELLDNSSDYYIKYSGKKDYYSFNYGNLHFLVLDSTGNKSMSREQKEWIKKDLEQTKNSGAIFVFIHNPLFFPVKFNSSGIETCKDFDLLHQYFTQYHIKAVFSGYRSIYFKMEVDGILYINAGCGGFNANDLLNGYCQYYIADYKNGELNVQPRYVNNK